MENNIENIIERRQKQREEYTQRHILNCVRDIKAWYDAFIYADFTPDQAIQLVTALMRNGGTK